MHPRNPNPGYLGIPLRVKQPVAEEEYFSEGAKLFFPIFPAGVNAFSR